MNSTGLPTNASFIGIGAQAYLAGIEMNFTAGNYYTKVRSHVAFYEAFKQQYFEFFKTN